MLVFEPEIQLFLGLENFTFRTEAQGLSLKKKVRVLEKSYGIYILNWRFIYIYIILWVKHQMIFFFKNC